MMFNPDGFTAIKTAIELLLSNPQLKRIDGDKWSVYFVGKIIRIDIGVK